MADVVVLGIFVADCTFRGPRLPHMEETLLGSAFAIGPGGKGSNQAVAAGRLGTGTALITKIGDDTFGHMGKQLWSEAGIDAGGVILDGNQATGAAMIFIEEASGENAILVTPGAAATLEPADVDTKRTLIEGAQVFMTQLEQPLDSARRGLELARAAAVTTILNPAPAVHLDADLLGLCDWITPNETEAALLAGVEQVTVDGAAGIAQRLRQRGANNVVITFGADGAFLFRKDGSHAHAPAVASGPVVETTGAGDAFNGAFASALARGDNDEAALAFGCHVAGISVTRAGAAASMPWAEEVR